jgi:hypothetical protein
MTSHFKTSKPLLCEHSCILTVQQCTAVVMHAMVHFCADRDVKVVAKELLYIASAPKLKLGQDDFVAWRESATAVSESFNRKNYKRLNKPKAPYKYELQFRHYFAF